MTDIFRGHQGHQRGAGDEVTVVIGARSRSCRASQAIVETLAFALSAEGVTGGF